MPHHPDEFASAPIAHVVAKSERADALRALPQKRTKRQPTPECDLIGHAWHEDPTREDWLICIVCDVVRQP